MLTIKYQILKDRSPISFMGHLLCLSGIFLLISLIAQCPYQCIPSHIYILKDFKRVMSNCLKLKPPSLPLFSFRTQRRRVDDCDAVRRNRCKKHVSQLWRARIQGHFYRYNHDCFPPPGVCKHTACLASADWPGALTSKWWFLCLPSCRYRAPHASDFVDSEKSIHCYIGCTVEYKISLFMHVYPWWERQSFFTPVSNILFHCRGNQQNLLASLRGWQNFPSSAQSTPCRHISLPLRLGTSILWRGSRAA